MKITFSTRIKSIEQRTRAIRSYRKGDETIIDREDMGWWIVLEHSNVSFFIGMERPEIESPVGRVAELTIEVRDAVSS